MLRKLLYLFIIVVLALGIPSTAFAQDEVPPAVPATDVSGLAVPDGEVVDVPPELAAASGEVQIVVRLKDDPLVLAVGQYAKKKGSKLTVAQQKAFVGKTSQNQAALIQQVEALGGRQIARIKIVLNAVVFSIDASKLSEVAKLTNVATIRPVVDYKVDLSETVPYIGATAVQNMKVTGKGVRVAVLDSGIDYIHYNLGGSGSVAEYDANDPTIIEPNSFPTAKVVGGTDFVGATWPNTDLIPDPDPLDTGAGGGHGTHVADIIAGKSLDGLHKGVAPDASLYAVKVCSSVSTSCSGVALLQGMDYAMDPNGDGSIADAVDVINMSLGSDYGQREDDLSQASANAAKLGVLVVTSAGNGSDKPFKVGSPSTTPEVISVAQTQVPSAKLFVIAAGAVSVGGSAQPWAAAPALVTGALQYGNGAGGNLNGCASFPAGSLTGKIVLVDRGVCSISIKVSDVADGGGLAAIIANNASQAPGDLPPDFSFGGGDPTRIAGYTITRADGTLLKTVLGASATIDPATAAGLVMNMVSSSSRGPSFSYAAIKPDLGAPGASLSAEFGTGNGQTAFGGTSGAAPMVSGAAALMVQAYPKRDPVEIKALLMNTAETNIGINPVGLPGVLAPITRIGGGEVRVDKAIKSTTSAWDAADETGSLSFGFQTISLPGATVFQKVVAVRNYTGKSRTYTITPTFRYADDAASGAVKITAPKQVVVPANSMKNFIVTLSVDPSKLPIWGLNGGAFGGDGYRLQSVEFDGYINIADAKDAIHLAWQILPHRSATVSTTKDTLKLVKGAATTTLVNPNGALDGRVDAFALLGTSAKIPRTQLPKPGDNFAIIDLKAFGARLVDIGGGQYGLQIAINTFGLRAHPAYPAEFDVYVDVNLDGAPDVDIYTAENGGFGATGQTLVYVVNINTGAGGAYFYADADLESGNMILTAPLSVIGITPTSQIGLSVYAFDNYFTGSLTDAIEGAVFTPGIPRYTIGGDAFVVPAHGNASVTVSAVASGETASPSQTGILFLYRDAKVNREADILMVAQ